MDIPGGCVRDQNPCGFTGGPGPAARFSLAASQSASCLVQFTVPPDVADSHFAVDRFGAMRNAATGGFIGDDDADNPGSFELAGADLSDLELDVVVLPPQADEFTCVSCFLVKHRSQIDHQSKLGPICLECAA
jgi:hypothetical protein